ncbi:SHQ1 protein [Skeletonema marinoi]|uniref:SHQ1 protein n=1 Tax=Skeletonema marinoi TaxID=267567 RepID=A0AAD8YB34_9STRA|nr:SHQ1 protein [Skeletonema marinoi]
MPITPRYSLTQTSTHLHIEVSIPHVRVSTSTIELRVVEGTEVNLYAPPTYLLRLTLPDRVIDEDAVEDSLSSSAIGLSPIQEVGAPSNEAQRLLTKEDLPKLQYNPEKNHGTLVVILKKEEEGIWQDLDLLGRLQQPTQMVQPKPAAKKLLVQEISENGEESTRSSEINEAQQEVLEECLSIQKTISYGLFKKYSNVFRDYARAGLAHEMLECPNPDEAIGKGEESIELEEQYRRELRRQTENEKFDASRYLNDLDIANEDDMIFESAIMMKPHWMEINKSDVGGNSFFTDHESHLLAELPRQTNIPTNLSAEQKQSALLCLLDILFAYVYDHRTTDGDPTVESSWTVMILSPTLSWLECYNSPYDTIADVIGWSIRRSLIYPYLRSYDLAKHIAEDVCEIMKRGRRTVIRCLLQLHKIMEQSESHYLFNKLYIDPLIGWIQQCEEDEVQQIGDALEQLLTAKGSNSSDVLGKQHLDLDLEDIEKRFFESDDEKDTSSSEDEDSSSTVDYESDDESGGDTEVTTDEERQTERLAKEDGNHSSALLDNNIGQEEGSLIQVMQNLTVNKDS